MCVNVLHCQKHAEEGLELFEQYMAADPKYDRVGRRKGPFWERCNAAFDAVDSGPVSSVLLIICTLDVLHLTYSVLY